ncbi:2-oxoglutarate and iron-dependent oxygenase domain-containing protein [Variovorax ginsengisoli]|uniref:2-oxoglutarate and iron-dependent oxygenase domain-containing protein n=1 Tax=Variovorax ginsengisoli TaxID=363844 RepID=A0ABT8SDT3_9BURK|nr:2-oxoglutarate and iron-dependent oxygenase domain-containing protein [Variovorax ginsengisoli]MDN8617914.1 2-oxoglutarate and iron-dependent oxygenase domain-containing protein [Variovorax ginsengisoli]MDO1537084.1 2-oxoglutarate and iron-dependent oxygenase domain-containing protein [Variovorax ginsengisoli]
MSRVPLVDIDPFLNGTPADRDAVARRVDAACRDSGFLMVSGHGVDAELLTRYEQHLSAFFALPLEEKQRIGVTRDSNRGWRGRDATALVAFARRLHAARPHGAVHDRPQRHPR